MESWMIVLIVIAAIVGLYLLYRIMHLIWKGLKWFWRRVIGPPIVYFFDNCCAPIGMCLRDGVFSCKECCVDVEDYFKTQPYQRV